MHSEIASLLGGGGGGGGGVALKKGGVLVIRPEDTEEGCKFSGNLHIDGVVSGREQSGSKYILKKCLATGGILQVPGRIRVGDRSTG
jgi:hypothetical protein